MDWERLFRQELEPLVPYAPGLRASEVRERLGGGVVHKLSSNESPYGPVPLAVAAIREVAPRLNIYPDGSARALKRALAEHLGTDERFLMVGNGSNELLRIIAQAVLSPGDECVFAWPSFVVYPMVVQLMGANAIRVPLTDEGVHDLEAMSQAVTSRTKMVFVCNPNNPTGTIVRSAEFERFVDDLPDHVLVVVDEAYYEYVDDPTFPDSLALFDGTRPLVVLRTFSKIYSLAGLRVGYGVAPEPLVVAVNKVREPFNVNTVGQVAAYYSLQDTAEVASRAQENARERARLCEAFDRLGVRWFPSQANFVYIHTGRPRELFEALLSHGVIVRDFGTAPALRVGIGTPSDTDATIAAFQSEWARVEGGA